MVTSQLEVQTLTNLLLKSLNKVKQWAASLYMHQAAWDPVCHTQ